MSAVLEEGKRAGWSGLAGGAITRCSNGRVGGDGGRDGDRGRRGDAEGRSLEGLVDQRRGDYEEQGQRQIVRGQVGDVREWRTEVLKGTSLERRLRQPGGTHWRRGCLYGSAGEHTANEGRTSDLRAR